MAVYFLSYALLFAYGCLVKTAFTDEKQINKRIAFVAFGLLFLLLALRHPSMGIDLGYGEDLGYLSSFQILNEYPLEEVRNIDGIRPYETGYVYFNILVGKLSTHPQALLIACAALSVLPIGWAIGHESDDAGFSAVIYAALPCALLAFSTLRQAIALGLLMLALCCVIRRRPVPFLLLVVLAAQFHKSAYLFLLAYPVYYVPVNFNWRLVSLAVLGLLYALRFRLYSLVGLFSRAYGEPDGNGSYHLLLLYVLLYVFCVIYQHYEHGNPDRSGDERQINGLMNVFYCACACQVLGGVHNVATRLGYAFTLSLPLLLPLLIARLRTERDRVLYRGLWMLFFVAFALYGLRSAEWAMANPYYWFWQTPPGL